MKIYFGHPKAIDYKKDLYEPIRNSALNNQHEIIFPHEHSDAPYSSKDFFKTCDLMIAEVSEPATGLGIEIGWADMLNVPVLCVFRKDAKIAGSLKVITDDFIEYTDSEDLIKKLEKYL
jgi:hypothetical protein